MTDYTVIPDSAVDPDAPVTTQLMYALRDNPIAVSEMDPTATAAGVYAPGAWYPVDDATGVIYDFAVDGVVSEITTPDFEDGWEYRLILEGLGHNSGGTPSLRVALYAETDATYSTYVSITSVAPSSGVDFYGMVDIPSPRSVLKGHIVNASTSLWGGSANAAQVGENNTAFIGRTTAQKMLRARLSFSSGDVDAGSVIMLKRAMSFTR